MDTIELARRFLRYCEMHPDQRFWQALTNWAGLPYVGYAHTPGGENFRDMWHDRDWQEAMEKLNAVQ